MDAGIEQSRIGAAQLRGTLLRQPVRSPAALFVHGWDGSAADDFQRLGRLGALGMTCAGFDQRGHGDDGEEHDSATREQGLADLLEVYDWLARQPEVDAERIGVAGFSYGGYLAALLAAQRPLHWLALRSPALYPDRGWRVPKTQLKRDRDLRRYRERALSPAQNGALRACSGYQGAVLLVRAGCDEVLPAQVAGNYAAAFGKARSLETHVLEGADHALGDPRQQQAYTDLLTAWLMRLP